ncbi:MAG: 5'-phosphate synthase pdxT subunit, partial [Natronomonas sp.]
MLKAGVIAVQGDVAEHAAAIRRAAERHGESVEVEEVRTAGVVPDCDLLLMPGGESTTISRLLRDEGIAEEIRAFAAGLIVAARDAK